MLQTSLQEVDRDEDQQYGLFPGYQQRDRQPLPAILPPQDIDIYQDADESQPLTSESQQDTPQHVNNQMRATPAVSELILSYIAFTWNNFYVSLSQFLSNFLLPFHP